MPLQPEMAAAAAASPVIIHHSPPSSSSSSSSSSSCDPHAHGCRWWPYSNSNDFGANTAMILIILLCALICALALNTAIRCFLRAGTGNQRLPRTMRELEGHHRKPNTEAGGAPLVMAPTVMYSAGMKLGGAEADCAICLSEFVEGEGIRVLGNCKHGFHVDCIERWLSSHSSCPTCRRSCLAATPTSTPTPDCCPLQNRRDNNSQLPVTEIDPHHVLSSTP